MKKQAYGVSRSRDRKGKIIHQELKPYTMCVHTFVGGGYESMAVLVAEVIKYETQDSARVTKQETQGEEKRDTTNPSKEGWNNEYYNNNT